MSTNGLVPFDYDDPRRPRPYVQDDEDGLLGGYGDDVPRGTTVPRGTDSANIQPDASANPRQGRQSPVLNMQGEPSPSEGEDMPFMPQRVHEAVAGGGEGSSAAAAAEVGGLGPVPGTYVTQPQNGRPTLAMVPQQQQNLSTLMPQPPVPVQGQPQPSPIDNMQSASDRLSGMARRPATDADIPKSQQHHGWRKALDIAAAVGMGAYTANPLAGVGVYKMMHGAPLRRAQETYDAAAAKGTADYERSKQLQAANVGEEKVGALEEKNRVTEERNKGYADKMESTFVAGTERPDAGSPTGYVADTVSGKTKPFTPKQDRAIGYDPKLGRFMMNGAPYVPGGGGRDPIAEGAALEAGLSTQFPQLANGPYTQRWEKEKKNQAPVTHIHNPSADEVRYNDWKEAFKRDNGREPTADEIRTQKFQPHGKEINVDKERSDAAKDRELEFFKEEESFKKAWNAAYKDADGKPDSKMLDDLRNEHDSRKASIESTYQQRLKMLEGNQPQISQGAPQAAPAAQPQQPAQSVQQPAAQQPIEQPIAPVRTPAPVQQKPSPSVPAQPAAQQVPQGMPQPNTIVQVGGQYHMVKGYNPTTKKPIISKEIYDPQTKQPVTQAQR